MKRLLAFFFLFITLFSQNEVRTNEHTGTQMQNLEMTLFYRPSCPFCQKVISYMDKHQVVIPMEDISDPEQRERLVAIGGKQQVPCLVINGKALYESDAIIAWLKDHPELEKSPGNH